MKNKCKCLEDLCNKCIKKTKKSKKIKPIIPINLIDYYNIVTRKASPLQPVYNPYPVKKERNDLSDLLQQILNKVDKPVNKTTISTQTDNLNQKEIVDDLITFDYLTDISPIIIPKKSKEIETQTDFEKEYTSSNRYPFLRTDSESDSSYGFKPSSLLNKFEYQPSIPFYSELYSSGSNKFIDKPLIFEEDDDKFVEITIMKPEEKYKGDIPPFIQPDNKISRGQLKETVIFEGEEPDEKYKGDNPPFIQPPELPKKISRGQLKETVIFEGEEQPIEFPKMEPIIKESNIIVEKKFTKPKVYKKKNPIIEEEDVTGKRNVIVEEEGIFEQLPEPIFEQVPESSFKPTIKNPNQAKYYKEKSDIIGKKQSDKYKNSTPEEQALIRKKWNEQVQKRRDELLTPEERVIKEAKREAKILKQEQYIMNLEDEQSKKIQHPKKEIQLMSKEDKRKKFKELKPEPLFENIITEPTIKKTTKKTSKISLNRKNLKDTLIEREMTIYDNQNPKKRGKPSYKSINDREKYKFAIISGLENATTEELKQMLSNNK